MKKTQMVMSFLAAFFLSIILLDGIAYPQEIRATTEDGREVILKKDGTWQFTKSSKPVTAAEGGYQKSTNATSVIKPKGERFLIWFDPSRWQELKTGQVGKTIYRMTEGDVYATVIAERLDIQTEALKELVIRTAQQASTDFKLTHEEYRQVNGKKVLCMEFQATLSNVPFNYLSYYHGGNGYTIQVLTYASRSLYLEYKSEMETFLNGLVISE